MSGDVENRPAGNVLAVARGRLVDGPAPRVEEVKVIYRQEPDLKSEHGNFGARLLFDKDGALFVTQFLWAVPGFAFGPRGGVPWGSRPVVRSRDARVRTASPPAASP